MTMNSVVRGPDYTVRDAAGGVIPIRKILKISGIASDDLKGFGFNIITSQGLYPCSFASERGARWKLLDIRKKIHLVANRPTPFGRGFFVSLHDKWGTTIPTWAIEHVGAIEKKSLSFTIMLGGMSLSLAADSRVVIRAPDKPLKQQLVDLRDYRDSLIYNLNLYSSKL